MPTPQRTPRTLHPVLAANVWQPGQSGNPSGLPQSYRDMLAIARAAGPEAMRRAVELMSSRDGRVALVAIQTVLDRSYGKPKDGDPLATAPTRPDLSALSDRERADLGRLVAKLQRSSHIAGQQASAAALGVSVAGPGPSQGGNGAGIVPVDATAQPGPARGASGEVLVGGVLIDATAIVVDDVPVVPVRRSRLSGAVLASVAAPGDAGPVVGASDRATVSRE